MEVKISKNKNIWDSWFLSRNFSEFLQSWEWSEFQKVSGKRVLRFEIHNNGKIVFCLQGFIHELGLGLKYIYFPRVELIDNIDWQYFFNFLKKEYGFIFVRFESVNKFDTHRESYFVDNLKLKQKINKTNSRQPKQTLFLNLEKTEDELLAQAHSKTRYNIRLSNRKGVIIKKEKDVELFWKVNKETTKRDKFKSHGKEYYKKMLEFDFSYQLNAYYNNKIIASNIYIHFGDVFVYLHGASSNQYRNVMSPYLVQWEAIKLAKKLGCKYYDFWGVSPLLDKCINEEDCKSFNDRYWNADDKWSGVTRFKVGFGGEYKEYGKAVDVVLNNFKYFIYKLVKTVI